MKYKMVKFLKYAIASSLVDIVKIENTNREYKDLKFKDVDRGSYFEVRWAGKTRHRNQIQLAVHLFHFRNEIIWNARCKRLGTVQIQVILVGMLTGVQDDIQCKILAALSTVKQLELELAYKKAVTEESVLYC